METAANDNDTKWAEETTTFLELVNKQKCQIGWKEEPNSTMHLELILSQRPLLLRWYNDTLSEIHLPLAARLDEPNKHGYLNYTAFSFFLSYLLLVISVIMVNFNKKTSPSY